jgi:hypothetical protein
VIYLIEYRAFYAESLRDSFGTHEKGTAKVRNATFLPC